MQAGLLTGAFSAERVASLPADDWRKTDDDFTTNLTANLAVADAIGQVADRRGVSRPGAAAAWTLAWPGVTGAIVGARSADQVDGWLDAATFAYDQDDLAVVADAIIASGAGEGPPAP